MKPLLSLFLFGCLTCAAQLPVIPMALNTSSSIAFPTFALAYRWVSSDLTTNTAVVSWVDRIQGNILTNGNSAVRPTNSASGVGFSGSTTTFLTNVTYTTDLNTATPLTLVWVLRPTGYPLHGHGMLNATTNNSNNGTDGFGTDKGNVSNVGGFAHYFNSAGTLLNGNINTPALPATIDVIVVITNNGNGYACWTNGVFAQTASAFFNTSEAFSSLGKPWTGQEGYLGFVPEMLFYTNDGRAFVSQIHMAATNTYKYSP